MLRFPLGINAIGINIGLLLESYFNLMTACSLQALLITSCLFYQELFYFVLLIGFISVSPWEGINNNNGGKVTSLWGGNHHLQSRVRWRNFHQLYSPIGYAHLLIDVPAPSHFLKNIYFIAFSDGKKDTYRTGINTSTI